MDSSIQKLTNMISAISIAEKEDKQVFINKQGDISVRGRLGQFIFDMKALVKGSGWKNEQISTNNQRVIDAFTKAITEQLTGGDLGAESLIDLYSKSVIRRYLTVEDVDNSKSTPLGSLGAARRSGKLPEAQTFINALNQVTKNRNSINEEFKALNSIWIEANRNGLPIHEEEFLILRDSNSAPQKKIEAKIAISTSLELMEKEIKSIQEVQIGLGAGVRGALHMQDSGLATNISKSSDKLINRLSQLMSISQILKTKLKEFP